jgi:hypothetical protein
MNSEPFREMKTLYKSVENIKSTLPQNLQNVISAESSAKNSFILK